MDVENSPARIVHTICSCLIAYSERFYARVVCKHTEWLQYPPLWIILPFWNEVDLKQKP